MRGPWIRLLLVALAVGALAASSGCTTGKKPSSHGGEKLPGTGGIRRSSSMANFSISPNGRWLLFEAGDPESPFADFVLYDLSSESGKLVSLSAEAEELDQELRGPDLSVVRWSEDGDTAWSIGLPEAFELDATAADPRFEVVETTREPPPSDWPEPSALGLRVVKLSEREVRLETSTSPARVLAQHRFRGLNDGAATLEWLSRSPEGDYLAYSFAGHGTFALPTHGFLLRVAESAGAEEPRLLGAPIYGPIRWHPTERFVFAMSENSSGDTAIFRWSY